MEFNTPRVLIAGTQSGSGKTTITCTILQMLVNQKIKTASFKCGPDYIDPMFHSKVIGTKSRNLDAFFCEDNTIKYLLAENARGCDMAIVEGVMGFYDGLNLDTTKASSYETAKIISAPVILTVNCSGMASSALAIIKGFKEFKRDSNIKGVILNNMTQNTFNAIKEQIEVYFKGEIKVIGFLPKLKETLTFKSRHLGLVTADEIADLQDNLKELAEIASETIDIEQLVLLAKTAPAISFEEIQIPNKEKIKLGVAQDSACCFYYKDNLDLLEKMGAEIVYFSPLEDKNLPDGISGLYIGGGYPELYLDKLSQNIQMKASVLCAIKSGMPCIAECGGFMYLTDSIDKIPMVGAIKSDCYGKGKLSHFGYVTITAKKDNLLCKNAEMIKAHEFHYYDSTYGGEDFFIEKQNGQSWQGVFAQENIYAGYPHIHFFQNIKIAENFYDKCIERKNKNA